MPVIEIKTEIQAPIEMCFDLARSVEMHLRSTASTGERAVGGVMTGLMNLNDEVTWEAIHLGIRQRLTSRITIFNRVPYERAAYGPSYAGFWEAPCGASGAIRYSGSSGITTQATR